MSINTSWYILNDFVLLKGFNGNKATLTFKMIMMLAMYIIETNPYIKQALQMTYSFVFLDEFQDTTAIQYAFVKECFYWIRGFRFLEF